MMQPMPRWLKSLTASFCVTWGLYGAPYEIHSVSSGSIHLPAKVVYDGGRTYKISPSVWSEETLSFSEGMPQKITVQKGDTVKTIAERYAVPTRTIIQVNGLSSPFSLKAGQTLTLYGPRIHIVRQGEDVYQIASKHNVGLSAVARTNKMKAPFRLKPGQQLILPASPVKISKKPRVHSRERTVFRKSGMQEKKSLLQRLKQLSRYRKLRFKRPLKGRLLSGFGPKSKGLYNDGMNIAGRPGAVIRASESGVIVYTGNAVKSYGNLILMKHKEGWITAYGHLSVFKVKKGDKISSGQVIGIIGDTGYVKSLQLHFEIRHKGKPVNPIDFL